MICPERLVRRRVAGGYLREELGCGGFVGGVSGNGYEGAGGAPRYGR